MHKRLRRFLARFGIPARGVIHIGAHVGQEFRTYKACGLDRQVWIEPQPDVFSKLLKRLPSDDDRVVAINLACGPERGEATMHLMLGNGESNSLLRPKGILKLYGGPRESGTIQVPVVPLDEVLTERGLDPSEYNLLSIDVQGYELPVLAGAERTLGLMDAVISEISEAELYEGNTRAGDLERHLSERGLVKVVSRVSARSRHGNAFFIRRELLKGWPRLVHRLIGATRR